MDLFLYHGQTSTCSSKVRIVLAEKGLEWTGTVLDLHKGDQFDPAYVQLNPNAVVPTLLVDGRPVIESNLIVQLVEEIGQGADLTPTDPVARARMRLWLKRIDEDLHPAISTLTFALAMRRSWQGKPVGELIAAIEKLATAAARSRRREILLDGLASTHGRAALHTARRYIRDWSDHLSGHSSGTRTATLADLAAASYFHRLDLLGLSWMWEDLQQVVDWYAVLLARASVKAGLLDWHREADLARFQNLQDDAALGRTLLADRSDSAQTMPAGVRHHWD